LIDLINAFAPLNNFKVHLDNKKLEGFLKPFVENDGFCIRDCSECTYCDEFVKKSMNLEEAETVCGHAQKFYREYDNYQELITNINPKKVSIQTTCVGDDGDFDF
ncbi:MAG: hypothetical protein GY757_34800, partial [bacterium]|nr:hypothetical protein [bacterium]